MLVALAQVETSPHARDAASVPAASAVKKDMARRGDRGEGAARPEGPAAASGPEELVRALAQAAANARTAFEAAMDDDLNTPGALAVLFDLTTALNRVTDVSVRRTSAPAPGVAETVKASLRTLVELSGVLGLRLETSLTPTQAAALRDLAVRLSQERPDLFNPDEQPDGEAPGQVGPALVDYMARGRIEARRRKDWATGDRVRASLSELGILLEDTPTGFKWRVR
jgi:cysteinyl-tRNA synthetase